MDPILSSHFNTKSQLFNEVELYSLLEHGVTSWIPFFKSFNSKFQLFNEVELYSLLEHGVTSWIPFFKSFNSEFQRLFGVQLYTILEPRIGKKWSINKNRLLQTMWYTTHFINSNILCKCERCPYESNWMNAIPRHILLQQWTMSGWNSKTVYDLIIYLWILRGIYVKIKSTVSL